MNGLPWVPYDEKFLLKIGAVLFWDAEDKVAFMGRLIDDSEYGTVISLGNSYCYTKHISHYLVVTPP
jgi:hypothetical protein